jgi:transketolase
MSTSPAVSPTLLANAIRVLSMDAVEKAKSGHPGMPMGMAEIAVALWTRNLRHNPANPKWPDRDRFVLSNGHGSMLHYSLLHFAGYDLPMEEIKNFRQLHSKTAGHPEVDVTPGVETTTGPLGQGIANCVGMALAEKLLALEFNKPGHEIVNHFTYAFLGDGCLMEGISHEVCALAGVWKLNKLIALYDDNNISIDGHVDPWFADDTPKRFEAYGWNVIRAVDGHNVDAVDAAIKAAKLSDKPTLICCKTIIGKGAPNKQGGGDVHGAALGDKEVAAVRETLGWSLPPFEMPAAVYDGFSAKKSGYEMESAWGKKFAAYSAAFPAEAAEYLRRNTGMLPPDFAAKARAMVEGFNSKAETIATRKASQAALDALSAFVPELLGGSADLTGSNFTNFKTSIQMRLNTNTWGNHINYGVREFGMAAIMNGVTLHGGYLPYGGTFLTFADYSRNAIRMAALMKKRVIHVMTHDSIGLGEDGPTHQSVEHVSSLRLIPNCDVWRPADTVETAVAWASAIERTTGPAVLALSRQNLNFVPRSAAQISDIARGGYIVSDVPAAQFCLIATGSELSLAIEAAKQLNAAGKPTRVVSMPCCDVFDRQSLEYKQSVLPASAKKIAVEAGVTDYWRKYVGLEGAVVGIDTFGESAPAGVLFKHFGITVEGVVGKANG